MNSRFLLTALLLAATTLLSAAPRSVSGSEAGPVVVLVSGAEGAVNLSHQGAVIRGWVFPGPFTSAVILAGPLDTVEWDGVEAELLTGGKEPSAVAQKALAESKSPRLLIINPDGAAQVVKAPEEEKEMDYDAASAATAEE